MAASSRAASGSVAIGVADLHLTALDSADAEVLDEVGEFDDSRIVRRPFRRGAEEAIEPRHVRVLVQLAVLLGDHGVDARAESCAASMIQASRSSSM